MPIWSDRQPATGPVVYTDDQADLRAAYNRGRMDERRNRRHHPIIALVVVVLALVGGWMVYLAAREGSFSSAGQVRSGLRGTLQSASLRGPGAACGTGAFRCV